MDSSPVSRTIAQTPSADSPLRVAVLGPVLLRNGDDWIAPAGRLGSLLILALASAPGFALSASALIDELWQDEPPRLAKPALHTLISRLRSAGAAPILVSEAGRYRLAVSAAEVDMSCAQQAAHDAAELLDSDGFAEAERCAAGALALWRTGVAIEDSDNDVARAFDGKAAVLRSTLHLCLARALAGLGRHAEAVDALELPLAHDPLSEDPVALALHSLGSSGRVPEALGLYADYRTRLRDRLGASPSPKLAAINRALLLEGDTEPPSTEAVAGPASHEGAREGVPGIALGLRTPPNALIGRDGDLERLTVTLAGSRAVTILGAGGLGKTRLATELALRLRTDFPAVVAVELAGVGTPEGVELAIAGVLGIREVGSTTRLTDPGFRRTLHERVVAKLSERRTLLLLDNCEHLIDSIAVYAADLLGDVDGVRILCTSRAPLAIAAETVYPLEPLRSGARAGSGAADGSPATAVMATHPDGSAQPESYGPAVDLFLARARAVRPSAHLPLPLVARLCDRLDGLPLAIELAAARTRSMGVDEIERRLGNRFALLRGADRSAPERHRTLQAVIEWSWNLLSGTEQIALRRLSLFADGVDAEAAGWAVQAEPADVQLELDGLVGQSLLTVAEDSDGVIRYRMLETVREFGSDQLAARGEAETVLGGMFGWAIALSVDAMPRLIGPDQRAAVALLAREHDNLVAIMREAASRNRSDVVVSVFAVLGLYFFLRGQYSEVIALSPAFAEAVPSLAPQGAPLELTVFGLMLASATLGVMDRRSGAVVRMILRRTLDSAPPLDPPGLAALGGTMARGGRRGRIAALGALCGSSDPLVSFFANFFSAQAAENEGRIPDAFLQARTALRLAKQSGNTWGRLGAQLTLAQLHSQSGHAEEALLAAESVREEMAVYGLGEEARQLEWVIASNRIAVGRADLAEPVFEGFTHYRSESPSAPGQRNQEAEYASIGWAGLAEVARASGEPELAARRYVEACAQFASSPLRSSPWYSMVAAAALATRLLDGVGDHSSTRVAARQLRARILAGRRLKVAFYDRPVHGTAVLAMAAWLLLDPAATELQVKTGAELWALAEALHSRQDAVSLHREPYRVAAELLHGPLPIPEGIRNLSVDAAEERSYALLADPRPFRD